VWEDATNAAGIPDLHFHDLRRTAVRNMRKNNVPQVIRMKISGHKTDSMERRYNIVDDADLRDAKIRMEQPQNVVEQRKRSGNVVIASDYATPGAFISD